MPRLHLRIGIAYSRGWQRHVAKSGALMGSHDDDDNFIPSDETKVPSTETVEQYLHLHEHIEQLRQDKRPTRPGKLSPEDARTYQAAALFRAATPGADDPDPAFVASLRARLEQEIATPSPTRVLRAARGRVSRRGLLAGGIGAAAAAAIGVAVGSALPHSSDQPATWTTLIGQGNGVWQAVATTEEIPIGGVKRFVTDAVVGFVRHTSEGYLALSGACTHMGCLLNWNAEARTFDCPCHGGRFTETGKSAPSSTVAYHPLPAIQTKVEDGKVWVYVAVAPPSNNAPTPDGSTGGYPNQ
jgi:Rieske Fe-S protein